MAEDFLKLMTDNRSQIWDWSIEHQVDYGLKFVFENSFKLRKLKTKIIESSQRK